MILFFCCFEIPFVAVRMWANRLDHPAPGEAEKRVCAAFGFKWATANGAALKLIFKDVDFAKIGALSTNL